jgi:CheY-like chemotaxis protein
MHELSHDRQNDLVTNPRKRVLIVEDNAVHRRLMENELRRDYDLVLAVDSQTAEAHLTADPAFDLVILDLLIPRRQGELATADESVRILRQSKVGTAVVVVVSGSPTEHLRLQLEELRVQRIFEKPFSLTEFRDYIESLLGTTQGR